MKTSTALWIVGAVALVWWLRRRNAGATMATDPFANPVPGEVAFGTGGSTAIYCPDTGGWLEAGEVLSCTQANMRAEEQLR
jgi:hypothetical protein